MLKRSLNSLKILFFAKKHLQICPRSIILIIVIIIDFGDGMDSTARKHSKKRDAILGVMEATGSHPGARWVYEELKPHIPGLSLGTVYRNINLFREEGKLISVGVVKGEERFDARVQAHPHFICTKCGKVIDIPGMESGKFEKTMEKEMRDGDIPGNLRIDYRRTTFYGLCGNCKEPPQPEL
jgi:Fur family peroxide stress response transcriptional regulator